MSLTLGEAARIACLDPCHFSKVFRKHVGIGFRDWRRRVRISWAIAALESGMHSLADVIRLSGYRDRRAFERAVKRLTGATPAHIYQSREDSEPRIGAGQIETQVKPQR